MFVRNSYFVSNLHLFIILDLYKIGESTITKLYVNGFSEFSNLPVIIYFINVITRELTMTSETCTGMVKSLQATPLNVRQADKGPMH